MAEDYVNIYADETKYLRGKTPEDIKQKCYNLCRDYLAGVWLKVGIDQIQVKRLSGGMTNQLYYCAITKPLQPINDEPQEVAIRLYGPKHINNLDCGQNERLTDVIIALLVSEHKLGPKIYGLFESGQIQHYYKHKQFLPNHQKDSKLVDELARKLARIHAINVPIKKSGNWIFEAFDSYYEMAYQTFAINDLIEECDCQTLKKYDLKLELEWLKKCVLQTNSPTVFCHNDFRGANIMVTENDNTNVEIKEKIVLCDFEYSSYGYRGIDLGSIFSEWGRTIADFMKLHDFPDDSVIKPFIDSYMNESIKIHGEKYSTNKLNTFEQLLKEVKVFTLLSNMFFAIFLIKEDKELMEDVPFDKKRNMVTVELCYKNYHHLKQKFADQNTFMI